MSSILNQSSETHTQLVPYSKSQIYSLDSLALSPLTLRRGQTLWKIIDTIFTSLHYRVAWCILLARSSFTNKQDHSNYPTLSTPLYSTKLKILEDLLSTYHFIRVVSWLFPYTSQSSIFLQNLPTLECLKVIIHQSNEFRLKKSCGYFLGKLQFVPKLPNFTHCTPNYHSFCNLLIPP